MVGWEASLQVEVSVFLLKKYRKIKNKKNNVFEEFAYVWTDFIVSDLTLTQCFMFKKNDEYIEFELIRIV